jgi:SAM-dependent methyltransferase
MAALVEFLSRTPDLVHPRARPAPWSPSYILLRSLAIQLRVHARERLAGTRLELLDIGCGERPYEHIFRPYVARAVGLDVVPGPKVDVVGPADRLPFSDNSFDCITCNQVLEHAAKPASVVSEAHRVLRSGGVAFMSTHGTARYHPNPEDYWRWTHAGLAELFKASAPWSLVSVYPNGGPAAALTYLLAHEYHIAARRLKLLPVAQVLTMALNAIAWRLDKLVLRRSAARPPALAPNYLVVAVR